MTLRPLLLLALTGCPASLIENPTGDCEPGDDGSRICYHSSGPDDQYLPDCDAPLTRELWRVFAQDAETAYMIPRPDSLGLTFGVCGGDDADLSALFEANGLCEATVGPDTVEVLNSMTPEDALAIGHALHERLVFTAEALSGGGWWFTPWAPDVDLYDACLGPAADDADLAALCADVVSTMDAGHCEEMARGYTEAEARGVAAALNALYGVD